MYSEEASNNDSYSEYIYYCATDDEVKKFESSSTSEISSFAESFKAEHQKTYELQNTMMSRISTIQENSKRANKDLKQELVKLKERENPSHHELKDELKELREIVESSRDRHELRQELAELRGVVERPPGHDELKKELAELRELVGHPPGHEELKEELSALKDLVKDLMRQLKSSDTTT
ncbi:hypothetical protein BGX34_001037 [Mortierella sp. NVP85]|nr:hypothetical protein BGX34_001037 [Mortierella sp. NVP85]